MDPQNSGKPCTDPFIAPVLKALQVSLLQASRGCNQSLDGPSKLGSEVTTCSDAAGTELQGSHAASPGLQPDWSAGRMPKAGTAGG